jgi:hypothetical protein
VIVFGRAVKGLHNEMNAVIRKFKESRDLSPKALQSMIKNGLEPEVRAVTKGFNSVNDGMAEERKLSEREEQRKKDEENLKGAEEEEVGTGGKEQGGKN